MLYWSFVFLIVAVVAAVLGFGGIAGTATSIAVLLFYNFVGLFLVSLIASLLSGGRRPPMPPAI